MSQAVNEVFIVSAKRTAIGAFRGGLASLSAPQLGAETIKHLLNNSSIPPDDIQECLMGQVLTAGSGQAPARQAALLGGLKNSTPAVTINKVCGSGLKTVMMACDLISLGRADVVLAGGQESMSQAPHLLTGRREGFKLGHQTLTDHIIKDGLWDPYHHFLMGNAAEMCAKEYNITRKTQDEFAVQSYKKAQKAWQKGCFDLETLPVPVTKDSTLKKDEEPFKVKFEKIPNLKPAFEKSGTVTAANASKINDGAAACILVSGSYLKEKKLKPLMRVIHQAGFAQAPEHFTTAPTGAIQNCLKEAGLKVSDIDLFEINEAFAVVALAVSKELGIPPGKLNIYGGAVALGHPIGASGARVLTTLIHALIREKKKYGLAAICLGGGEALALLVQNPHSLA